MKNDDANILTALLNHAIEHFKGKPANGHFTGGNVTKTYRMNDDLRIEVYMFNIDLSWQTGSYVTFYYKNSRINCDANASGSPAEQLAYELHATLQESSALENKLHHEQVEKRKKTDFEELVNKLEQAK